MESGATALAPLSFHIGPELPDIIGSICSMAAIVVYARMRKGEVPEEYRTKAASTAEGDSDALDVREAVI